MEHKIRDGKICGKVGVWLAAFLDSAKRKQAVQVDGVVSDLSPVISGVPQGTVLGPVLFLIHIVDIAQGVSQQTTTSSCVDDTRVKRHINDPQSDCSALQEDLQTIYDWADKVNMMFNSDKFELLRFWPSNKPDWQYLAPDGSAIEEKGQLRDLGVQISSDLSFTTHINNTITGANRLIGMVMRTFRRRSRFLMVTVWKTIIQPKLDYCSQLWSPSDQFNITRLESVMRNFTSKIDGCEGLNYWERLHRLQLLSQERRRERYQLILI